MIDKKNKTTKTMGLEIFISLVKGKNKKPLLQVQKVTPTFFAKSKITMYIHTERTNTALDNN
jgi:hypothetical protein